MQNTPPISDPALTEQYEQEKNGMINGRVALVSAYNEYRIALNSPTGGNTAKAIAGKFRESFRLSLMAQSDVADAVRRSLRQERRQEAREVLLEACDLNRISRSFALELSDEGGLDVRKELKRIFTEKRNNGKNNATVFKQAKPRPKMEAA